MIWTNLPSVGDVFKRNAEIRGHETAFIFGDQAFSFDAVNRRTNSLCHALAARGLVSGDRCAVLSFNRPEIFEVVGCSKAGLTPVPLNWRLTAEEQLNVLSDCRPRALIVSNDFVELIDGLRDRLNWVDTFIVLGPAAEGWLSYEDIVASGSSEEPPSQPGLGVASITYTSGTTGRPKGAMLSHGGVIRNAASLVDEAGILQEGDVVVGVMPFFHVGGFWYYAFPAFALGCKLVILPSFDPDSFITTIAEHRASAVHIVPTMLNALIANKRLSEVAPHLRRIFYAGSPIPVPLLRQALTVLPVCDFIQGFGSTEGAGISFLSARDHRAALDGEISIDILASCGKPFLTTEITLELVSDPELSHARIGEVCIRSPNIMLSYWDAPELTREVYRDGWLHTGDIGRFDEDGYLHLFERKNSMIVTGGENVYPFEVERVIMKQPDVVNVAVFGQPDPHWVERVIGAVVLKPGSPLTPQQIIAAARQELAGYKCPKEVIVVSAIPTNAAGKVQRSELKRLYSDARPHAAMN